MASTIKKPSVIKGPAVHSPAGGVAPRTGRAYVGHAIHQHRQLQGAGSVVGIPAGKLK